MKDSQAYKNEDREDKRYKKGYKKNEGGNDQEGPPMRKKKNGKKSFHNLKEVPIKGGFDHMKTGELRSHLHKKKKALLTKSGFPEGGIPRSKAGMRALCHKLKRKRW
jgi:hypothetical protein